MPYLRSFINPRAYKFKFKHFIEAYVQKYYPDYRGIIFAPPGHFYSPLIKISEIENCSMEVPYDGKDYWKNINLRHDEQNKLFQSLIPFYKKLGFPEKKTPTHQYYSNNQYFPKSDACLLASLIELARPRKIIEIGSGFSSAVIIDTIKLLGVNPKINFIEPYPDRLKDLLNKEELEEKLIVDIVQNCKLDIFDELESGDMLFIDSSHVAKIGSDVVHIIFKILPRLKKGVLVHFHDIFYPESYPIGWVQEGKAWNESIFLRCFLMYNKHFNILAFNAYAWKKFPQVFLDLGIDFRQNSGASLWIEKVL